MDTGEGVTPESWHQVTVDLSLINKGRPMVCTSKRLSPGDNSEVNADKEAVVNHSLSCGHPV